MAGEDEVMADAISRVVKGTLTAGPSRYVKILGG